jgi:hypothetical protein
VTTPASATDPLPAALRDALPATLVDRLACFSASLRPLVENLSDEEALWRPSPQDWSVIEIVRHLLDEEREDFRPRLEHVLRDPVLPWPPIDPMGAAATRGYRDRPLRSVLRDFELEREASVGWLRGLLEASPAPDWTAAHVHPKFGPIHAGDLLAAWAAHDLLHLRQIAKRLFGMLEARGEPFRIGYAGAW